MVKKPVLNYFETAPSHTVETSKGGAPKLRNLTSRPGRTVENLKDGASILEIFDKSPSQTVGYLRVRTPRLGKNLTSRLLPAAVEEFVAPEPAVFLSWPSRLAFVRILLVNFAYEFSRCVQYPEYS